VEKTEKLNEFQETDSTEEELKTIPMLSIQDIRKEALPIQNEEYHIEETLLLHQDVCTNGIAYLNLMFDTRYVKKEYLPYLGILKATLGMIDTADYAYGDLFNEINIRTGGIGITLDTYNDKSKKGKYKAWFNFRAKTMYGELPFVEKMVEEMIFTSKLEDEKRLYEILAQLKSRLQMGLNASGHSTAAVRSMAYFSNLSAFNDAVSGITFYKLVEELEEHFEEKKEELIAILKELVRVIFRKDTLMVSCTAEQEGLGAVKEQVSSLLGKLPTGELPVQEQITALGRRNEGFQTSAKIQYVARSGNFSEKGFAYTGAFRVLKSILNYTYLWNNIRVIGGAYGCMSGFGLQGNCYFASYRDPHLKKTNETMEGIAEYLRTFDANPREMTKYIIGTISELDTPLTPMATGARSLNAYMADRTFEEFQKERDEILQADPAAIRALAEPVEVVLKQGNLCVLGNEEKLAEEKELFDSLVPLVG
jgi:hypothetical protein